MTTLTKFTEQAANWNALRYEQKFDLSLTLDMIDEEMNEYNEAKDLVEQVDALCDICFIAAGALWKLNLKFDLQGFNSFFNFYQLEDLNYNQVVTNVFVVMHNYPGLYNHACALHQILASTFDMLSYKLASRDNAILALLCIANSNDTKSVKNIPVGAKYSEEGKGNEYVPPTAALTQLIAEIANEVKH